MIMKYLAQSKKEQGFTLLETLVAISILVLAITATFSVAQNGLSSSMEARDQVIAFYLAQEAVEMVRNKRDENSLTRIGTPSTHWLSGIAEQVSDPCYFGKVCTVDAVSKVFTACPGGTGTCANVYQDTNNQSNTFGLYSQNTAWTQTNFNREISLSQATSTEMTISVTVKWVRGLLTRTFTVQEIIRDWQ